MNRRWSVVHALTSQILLVLKDQIRRGWGLSESGVDELVRHLLRTGLVEKTTLLSPRPEKLLRPICSWSPADPMPNMPNISYVKIKNWRKPPRRQSVFYASAHAANLTGGLSGRPTSPFQAQHNLQITEVYLTYRRNWPALAECWVLPEILPKDSPFRAGRGPDAFLIGSEGVPFRAIEVVGSYPVARLTSLHDSCLRLSRSHQQFSYELW